MSRKKKIEAEEIQTLDETPEESAEETTPEETEEVKSEPVAYIGPSIKHVVTRGTVFNNGLPVKLQKKIEEIPAIRGLIVPVSRLAESCTLRETEGTALYNLYRSVLEKL